MSDRSESMEMVKDHSNDTALVTLHEKGFWQADLFCGAVDWDDRDWEDGTPPDDFFTLKVGQSMEDAFARAREKWPGVQVSEGCEVEEDEV
jgi:hypothetical protein